jgi:hypothetical protein
MLLLSRHCRKSSAHPLSAGERSDFGDCHAPACQALAGRSLAMTVEGAENVIDLEFFRLLFCDFFIGQLLEYLQDGNSNPTFGRMTHVHE